MNPTTNKVAEGLRWIALTMLTSIYPFLYGHYFNISGLSEARRDRLVFNFLPVDLLILKHLNSICLMTLLLIGVAMVIRIAAPKHTANTLFTSVLLLVSSVIGLVLFQLSNVVHLYIPLVHRV